jgi:5-methylcytosine-specific restriction endonuclease McrA
MLNSLKDISNETLVSKLKSLKTSENYAVAEIILYLSEIDLRKLYRELGYSSLFSYCTECLGYSESAAYRRIQAARSLDKSPEIYDLIKSGRLSLCAVAEISKVKEESNKKELLKVSEGKSKREVQVLTAKYQPAIKPKKELIRAKKVILSNEPDLFNQAERKEETEESFTISIEVDKEFMALFNEVKAMIGHVPAREIFRRTLKEFHSKRNVIKRRVKIRGKESRYIPKADKIAVFENDNKQCRYISPDGKRCSEKHGLEIDHIKPYATGGSRDISNLRLLCKSHNLYMAEKAFGSENMQRYFK